ncbi:MAG: hypothetical protein AB2A00_21100 [Myxococcota bacterium]
MSRAPRAPHGYPALMSLLTGTEFSSLLWMLGVSLFLGGMGALVGLSGDEMLLTAFLVVMGVPVPVAFLYGLLRYPAFRDWRARLPFRTTGEWSSLAVPSNDDTWHPSVILVTLRTPGAEKQHAVEDLLRRFCDNANRSLLRGDFGTSAATWTAKGLTARGDLGGRVGWKLYRFVTSELARCGDSVECVDLKMGEGHRVHIAPDTMS